MASPQKENGYTSISNELFEKIYQLNFSLREVRIILAVIRFTYGFNRKTAQLSLRFLEQATQISLRHVTTTIKKLVNKNVLLIKNDYKGIRSREIQLNKNYETWNLSVDQKSNTKNSLSIDQKSNSSVAGLVIPTIHQKSNQERQKKTIKKTIENFPLLNQLKEIEGFSELWNDWTEYRKEIKKPLTHTAIKRQILQLIKFKQKGYNILEIIDTSITKRWQGFFEPKENTFRNNGHKEAALYEDF